MPRCSLSLMTDYRALDNPADHSAIAVDSDKATLIQLDVDLTKYR